MFGIFGIVRELVAEELERSLKSAVAPVAPYLRKLSTGLLLISLSIWSFALGLLFAATALFLSLAEQQNFAQAAIITTLPCVVFASLLLTFGITRLRQPR